MFETLSKDESFNAVLADSETLHDLALYASDLVKKICETVGPGLPGTPQERARALLIHKELEAHLGAEHVSVEEFPFHPLAFIGSERISALSLLAAVLLNLAAGSVSGRLLAEEGAAAIPAATAILAAASLLFAAVPLLLFLSQFIRGGAVVDRLFPKGTSINVIGSLRKPGTQTVRRLLIVSGHHDSAWEDTWLRLLGGGFYAASLVLFLGMVAMPLMSLIQLVGAVLGSNAFLRAGTLPWLMLAFPMAPSILFGMVWHRAVKPGGVVPGAVDNLAASALAVTMCRFLVAHPTEIPVDTEIRFISFGSEEAGLRGSSHYVARHLEELERLEARVLNCEMVAHAEIAIMASDKNGLVKNDQAMVSSLTAAAVRAGVPYRVGKASLGTNTDAAPFTEAGLKAAALIPFQFPQQFIAFYHQRWDTPDKVTIPPLENVLKLTREWIHCGGE